MAFTCELHNQRFATLDGLKKHDADYHSKSKDRSKIRLPLTPPPPPRIKRTEFNKLNIVKVKSEASERKVPSESEREFILGPESERGQVQNSNVATYYCEEDVAIMPIIKQEPLPQEHPSSSSVLISTSLELEHFQCHICAQSFTEMVNLNTHMESHLVDKKQLPKDGDKDDVKIKNEANSDSEDLLEQHSRVTMPIYRRPRTIPNYRESSESEPPSEPDDNDKDPDFNIEAGNDSDPEPQPSTVLPNRVNRNKKPKTPKQMSMSNQGIPKNFSRNYRNAIKNRNNINTLQSCHYDPLLPQGQINCYFCGYRPIITRMRFFERHIWKHTLEKPYTCRLCCKRCEDNDDLLQHEKSHEAYTEVRPFKCKHCDLSFRIVRTLERHVTIYHSNNLNPKLYRCQFCPKSYTTSDTLYKHKRRVHGPIPKIHCEVCKKFYKRKDVWSRHMRQEHPGVNYTKPPTSRVKKLQYFSCRFCSQSGTVFSNMPETDYVEHMKTRHNDLKPFYCTICNDTFKYTNSLRRHVASHHERHDPVKARSPMCYQCIYCDRKTPYHRKDYLKEHLKNFHPGKTALDCGDCIESFCDQKDLDNHRKERHSNPPNTLFLNQS